MASDNYQLEDYTTDDRKAMADKGQALPDGSFPIANTTDLKNAVRAIGRAKDPAAAKAHIISRAKTLGASELIPDGWKSNSMSDNHLYTLLREGAPGEVVDLGAGKQFRKQLVKFGNWVHPHGGGQKMKLDREWAEKITDNFNKQVTGRVPVPLGHPTTSADLALMNRGELKSVVIEDDGLYGVMDVRDEKAASDIENDLLFDVSISWDPNYVDKLSGEDVGPALLHVGLLTDPYLKGMKPFEALANKSNAIMLSENKEQEVATTKVTNDRDFPVEVETEVEGVVKKLTLAVGAEVEVLEAEAEKVLGQIKEAAAPVADEAKTDVTADAEAVAKAQADQVAKDAAAAGQTELEKTQAELADAKTEIALRDAKSRYSTLLAEGKIVPAQEAVFMSLSTAAVTGAISLADGKSISLADQLAELFKNGRKQIRFGEQGVDDDGEPKTPFDELSAEEQVATEALGVSRDEYNEVNGSKSTKKEEAK